MHPIATFVGVTWEEPKARDPVPPLDMGCFLADKRSRIRHRGGSPVRIAGMVTLSPQMLLRAYAIGVFPMAESRDDPEVYWIDPELRGVLPLDSFHMPRRLKRTVRQRPF